MLVEPNLDVMLHDKRVGNKFALVTLTLKRARQLNDGSPATVLTNAKKPVSVALYEIYANKISVTERSEEDTPDVLVPAGDEDAAALAATLGAGHEDAEAETEEEDLAAEPAGIEG